MLNQIVEQLNPSMPGVVAQFISSREITTKAKSVSDRIKSLVREAKQEYKYARTAKHLALTKETDATQQMFGSIAAWHYRNAATQFRAAADALRFTSMLDLSPSGLQYIELKMIEFDELGRSLDRKATELSTTFGAAGSSMEYDSAAASNN